MYQRLVQRAISDGSLRDEESLISALAVNDDLSTLLSSASLVALKQVSAHQASIAATPLDREGKPHTIILTSAHSSSSSGGSATLPVAAVREIEVSPTVVKPLEIVVGRGDTKKDCGSPVKDSKGINSTDDFRPMIPATQILITSEGNIRPSDDDIVSVGNGASTPVVLPLPLPKNTSETKDMGKLSFSSFESLDEMSRERPRESFGNGSGFEMDDQVGALKLFFNKFLFLLYNLSLKPFIINER